MKIAEGTRPTQCCCFSITSAGTNTGTELSFGLVLIGKAGSLGVKLNVNWLSICYQKAKEKCPLAQLPKKMLDVLAEDT